MRCDKNTTTPEKKERKYTGVQKIFKEGKEVLSVLILFKNGEIVDRQQGFKPKAALEEMISKAK